MNIEDLIEKKTFITIYYDDLNDFIRDQFGFTEDEYQALDDMQYGDQATVGVHKIEIGEYELEMFELRKTEACLLFLVNQDRIPEGTYLIWYD